jgi:chemotaxis protein histidine kinase CheA
MMTPDNSAEAQLQQELREMFLIDTQQQLETYFDIIQRLTLESWIADIQSIYRAIHTIKGGAVTVDANSMLHAAMVLEDLLSDLRYLEVAPPLSDGKLSQILLEAGELLASCLEISDPGSIDGDRVQLTIQRLQILHAQVKEQYLPDWDEMKQVHQEFAEQGFDLVVLDLEMELANLPAGGAVPINIIQTAQATIAQLTQIGTEIELAADWTVLIHRCEGLISNPDSQLWRAVWLPYFEVLKACVKNSGELIPADIDRLDAIESAIKIAPIAEILPVEIEEELGLPDLFDSFFDEDLLSGDELTLELTASDDATLDRTIPPVAEIIPVEIEEELGLSDDLFGSFFDEDLLSGDELTLELTASDDDTLDRTITPIAEISPVEATGSLPENSDLASLFDDSFLDEDLLTVGTIEEFTEDESAANSTESPSLVDSENRDLPDLLDNFFDDEIFSIEKTSIETIEPDPETLPVIEHAAVEIATVDDRMDFSLAPASAPENVDLAIFLDDLFVDEDLEIESVGVEEELITDSGSLLTVIQENQDLDLDSSILSGEIDALASFVDEDFDDFNELANLDELALISLIENDSTTVLEPTAETSKSISVTAPEQLSPSPVATTLVEAKRGISIPVPLERLDRSAQQVVDTLLTARAVMNVSSNLNAQLSQLSLLTQESSHFVAKLRQLQDNYAVLRNLSDDQDSTNNVTTERYRQGYTTIVRLVENMLRMSELGQEIETATYQNNHHLVDLDRSILRLKDGIETSRLVPFRNLTLRAKAILRDLTNRYGKPAELIVQNEQVELDAGIVQQLEPALLHLLRNAYDHGVETTEKRLAAGKPERGMILVSLNRRGNLYRLEVEDDGGGIDANIIYQIAKSKGFPIVNTITKPEKLTNSELLAILCQPGFSSSSSVSEVSGRGVGMDVVVAQIATIGGKLILETSVGHGTKFTIEVPAPQLLVPCVLFQVGERTVAFPTEEVLETALLSSLAARMSADDQVGMCAWTLTTSPGNEVSGFDLANYWHFAHRSLPDTAICIRTRQGNDGAEIWSIADDLLEQAELLINPLPSPLIAPVGLLGVSLQSDGRLISILDPIALTARLAASNDSDREYGSSTFAIEQSKPSAPTILIVDDAALMRRRFEASLNTCGFITYTCNDGLEALNWLQSNPRPDLMITDVEMPNMDGFTLIDRARQAQIDIPILVVSSRSSEEWGKEARRLGANDYLNKGFGTAELLQKVNALLGLLVEA